MKPLIYMLHQDDPFKCTAAKLGRLSSVEALAGAFYILNEKELAIKMMDKFKWGHTFLQLNANLLDDYADAETEEQVVKLEEEYFPQLVRNYFRKTSEKC